MLRLPPPVAHNKFSPPFFSFSGFRRNAEGYSKTWQWPFALCCRQKKSPNQNSAKKSQSQQKNEKNDKYEEIWRFDSWLIIILCLLRESCVPPHLHIFDWQGRGMKILSPPDLRMRAGGIWRSCSSSISAASREEEPGFELFIFILRINCGENEQLKTLNVKSGNIA